VWFVLGAQDPGLPFSDGIQLYPFISVNVTLTIRAAGDQVLAIGVPAYLGRVESKLSIFMHLFRKLQLAVNFL
jgi:hypothetical protein